MKKFISLVMALAAISLVSFGFVSCSDDDDDNSGGSTEAISGTYKGTFEDRSDGTCYFIVYINSDYTWYSDGYKNDATYTTKSNVGTISEAAGATYVRNGNTLSMTIPYMGKETAVTTDNWKTMTLSGTFPGKLTKQE